MHFKIQFLGRENGEEWNARAKIRIKYSQRGYFISYTLHSTSIRVDTNDETCSSSKKRYMRKLQGKQINNVPNMPQMLSERTLSIKATSKSPLTRRIERAKGKSYKYRV